MDEVLFYKRKRISTYFLPDDNDKRSTVTNSYNPSSCHKSTSDASLRSDFAILKNAIENNETSKVKNFLRRHPRIDVNKIYDDCSLTLLHFAVGNSDNKPEMIELLLRKGGDPNNTNIEENLTPLHISALYDFDKVMEVLIKFGGNLEMRSDDGYNCYEIVRQNVENELRENCFKYLFLRSVNFRRSMGPRPSSSQCHMAVMRNSTSISDGSGNSDVSVSFESSLDNAAVLQRGSRKSDIHSAAKRLFPNEYEYLISESEDRSPDMQRNVTSRRKKTTEQISTIPEESGVIVSDTPSMLEESLLRQPHKGIASTSAPFDFISTMSYSGQSSATQPTSKLRTKQPIPELPAFQPTKEDLHKLQKTYNQLKVNTSAVPSSSISGFSSNFSGSVLSMQTSLALNFSPELQDGLNNLDLIREWGNLKVDFVQNSSHENTIKSYKNYLLLNTKSLKNVNFSGNHLKTAIIDSPKKFQNFLDAIFYIGNVKGNQPLEHLVDAKAQFQSRLRSSQPKNKTISSILQIWNSGLGVRVVEVFGHSSESEVTVNQATMIDAMGSGLAHLQGDNLDGTVVSNWTQKMKNQFGSSLLHHCYRSFLVSNNKKGIFPNDKL